MDKTPGKPNPMKPEGATDPLEDVQGKKKSGNLSDTKVAIPSSSAPFLSPSFLSPAPFRDAVVEKTATPAEPS